MPNYLSTGPALPYSISNGKMATSPDGKGVILFGGSTTSSHESDAILELKSDGQGWVGTWTTLSVKLQYLRYLHVVWVKKYIKIKIVYRYSGNW